MIAVRPTSDGPWWRRAVHLATGQPSPWVIVDLARDDSGELVIEWDNGHTSPIEGGHAFPPESVRWEWVGPIPNPSEVAVVTDERIALTAELDRINNLLHQAIHPMCED